MVGGDAEHEEGWIRWNRHFDGANYLYFDGHVKWLRWRNARRDQFPDHVVRAVGFAAPVKARALYFEA